MTVLEKVWVATSVARAVAQCGGVGVCGAAAEVSVQDRPIIARTSDLWLRHEDQWTKERIGTIVRGPSEWKIWLDLNGLIRS